MFRQRQDSDNTRIRLPRRSMPPTKDYLEFAFNQAFQYRDKEVEITWTDYSVSRLFSLILKAEREKNHPYWTLWEESSQGSQLLWSDETSDLESIEQKIAILDPTTKDIIDTMSGSYPHQGQSKPDSPYRRMFSASYHGIKASLQSSLRESLTRMRPPYSPGGDIASGSGFPANPGYSQQKVPSASGETLPIVSDNQAAFPGTVHQASGETIRHDAPALAIKQMIIEGLASITGGHGNLPVYAVSNTVVSGSLEQSNVQNKHLIKLMAINKITGKLELINQVHGSGEIFFEEGTPYNASVSTLDGQSIEIKGDEAIVEMILWTGSSFRFFVEEHAITHDVSNGLDAIINHALSLRDQLVHLEKAGLQPQSLMVKKQENLGDNELRLLLSKNVDTDAGPMISVYRNLPKRFTVNQLFQRGQVSKSEWLPIVFSLFANGLIEIRTPLAVNEISLDFLGDAKAAVQNLKASFTRQETGILSYPAFLYFLQYEYLRFQANDTPLSLIIFGMNKASNLPLGGLDLINKQETLVALRKIVAIKRPLDLFGHFETIDYALLLPDTTVETACQIAQQMAEILKSQPLSAELKPDLLKLSFGVGNIPRDGTTLESLIVLTKKALQQSKSGDFVVVRASNAR